MYVILIHYVFLKKEIVNIIRPFEVIIVNFVINMDINKQFKVNIHTVENVMYDYQLQRE